MFVGNMAMFVGREAKLCLASRNIHKNISQFNYNYQQVSNK